MINYRSTTDAFITKLNDKNIDQLTFRITDAEDNLIDFNGIDFEFTLKVFENQKQRVEIREQQPLLPPPPQFEPYQPLPIEPLNEIIEKQRIENILNKIKNIK